MVRSICLINALAFATGCQALVGIHDLPSDAEQTPDASVVDASGQDCAWTSLFFEPCALGQPGPALVLDQEGTYTFNTDTGVLTDPDLGPIEVTTADIAQGEDGMARVLFAESVAVNGPAILRAVGTRSFILAAWNEVTIDGIVDVSSFRDATGVHAGAGADVFCAAITGIDGASNPATGAGGSGGAGGSAAQPGGAGGDSLKGVRVLGGRPDATFEPTVIRGGCPGGTGLGLVDAAEIGEPGAGGGGVLVAARVDIQVAGRLSAGGAGGGGGQGWAGGGGGGSGGLIAMESAQIDIQAQAQLYANGGGGGGAAAHDEPGTDGESALLESPVPALAGLPVNAHAGPGGAGGFGELPAGPAPEFEDSGGGGGGGVGHIRVIGSQNVDPAAVFSPPRTVN